MQSPFLNPDVITRDNQLAILHIRRDQSIPTILSATPKPDVATGYAEGVVTNTRFGSFPHSTLVGLHWGTQVRASVVDTGSRGRWKLQHPTGQKRKAEDIEDGGADDTGFMLDSEEPKQKEAVAANSGFIHVLPPTPENWTISLPHRTQVVYTPDYSYILHRIRARPGSVLIETGSGSGSFTHAAARAVFNGYSKSAQEVEGNGEPFRKKRNIGRVFSYEFHADRYAKVKEEMKQHSLDGIVIVTERDVYGGGFAISDASNAQKVSPSANAIFLDLPAPWQALPHLTRHGSVEDPSPLDPHNAVHICTFSPCIEQAQKTVSALRRHGWLDIEMVEMQQKRIEIRREYAGLEYEGMRGVNAIAATVDEALARLEEVEQRAREFHSGPAKSQGQPLPSPSNMSKSKQRRELGKPQEAQKTLFKDGRLVHRTEPELKTHTSYLVFAVLPMEWTEEDEAKAREKWTTHRANVQQPVKSSKSQMLMKREARHKPSEKAQEGSFNSLDVRAAELEDSQSVKAEQTSQEPKTREVEPSAMNIEN